MSAPPVGFSEIILAFLPSFGDRRAASTATGAVRCRGCWPDIGHHASSINAVFQIMRGDAELTARRAGRNRALTISDSVGPRSDTIRLSIDNHSGRDRGFTTTGRAPPFETGRVMRVRRGLPDFGPANVPRSASGEAAGLVEIEL